MRRPLQFILILILYIRVYTVTIFIYSLSTNVDRFSYNPDQPPQLACQGPLSSVELAKELVMSWSEFHFKPIIYKRNMHMVC